MKKLIKDSISIESRISEIKKTQTNFKGDIIKAPSDEIIKEWISIMSKYIELTVDCDLEFKKRAKGKQNQMDSDSYNDLHAECQVLQNKVANFRSKLKDETGFYLKWAI